MPDPAPAAEAPAAPQQPQQQPRADPLRSYNFTLEIDNNAQGYFQVNQNSGNLNAQLNVGAVSLGAGLGDAFAILNDSSLGGVVSNNTYNTTNTTSKADAINGGFDGFRGVAQITQSSGDGNAVSPTYWCSTCHDNRIAPRMISVSVVRRVSVMTCGSRGARPNADPKRAAPC